MTLRARRSEEGGFAIVMALVVTAIVFVVMAGILAQAIHNVVLSGYGRRRLTAVNAAEAGLNWYASQLGTSNLIALGTASLGWTVPGGGCASSTSITSTCWYVFSPTNATAANRTVVATVPEQANFEIRVLYTSQNPCKDPAGALNTGSAKQCGTGNIPLRPTTWATVSGTTSMSQTGVLTLTDTTAAPFPDTAYAIVRSTGIVGNVRRTLESYSRIRAIRGNLQGGLASISLCLGSAAKVDILGDLSVNNEAVDGARPYAFSENCPETYASGSIVIPNGGSLTLTPAGDSGGSLTVRGGGVTVGGTTPINVARDLWAEGAVTIGSGTSSLTTCPAGGTVQCVGGDVIASSATIGSNAFVAGDTIICNPACPPAAAFPDLPWRESDWTKAGWIVEYPSTTTGLLTLVNATTTQTVYRVTSTTSSTCDLTFDAKVVTVNTNVAIVSTCRFIFSGNSSTIEGSGSLLLISAAPDAGATTADCGTPASSYLRKPFGPKDVSIQNNPTITAGLFIYTPCILWLSNNQSKPGDVDYLASFKGQLAARYIIANNSVTMREASIADFVTSIPGQITRFYQDVKFVREIPWGIAAGNLAL